MGTGGHLFDFDEPEEKVDIKNDKKMNVTVNLDKNIGEALLNYASMKETDVSNVVQQALVVFLRAHADKLAIRKLVF